MNLNSRTALIATVTAAGAALALMRSAPYASGMQPNGTASVEHPDPSRWRNDAITIANLGHASLLINYHGIRVLTDPSLFSRVGFSVDSILTIGPKRVSAPPMSAAQLQSIDVLLITHAHMDHLDLPSLKVLPKSVVLVGCEHCSSLLVPLGYTDVRELRWGERTEARGLKVTAMGANHWGKRWPPYGTSYGFNSYVLEKDGFKMLLACDSAMTDLFGALASNPPEVAVFSIGAYDPWIWNHANPEQVWEMFKQTGAQYLVPVHWGTFKLSKEPMDEPMKRLIGAAGNQSDRIVLREIGGTWTMPETATTCAAESVQRSAAALK